MTDKTVPIRSICVYCGSSPGRDSRYREAGLELGRAIAEHGMRLVYGGGTRGIMGAVAEGVLAHGGKVLGIIPEFLMTKEASKADLETLTELVVTEDMHQRKHRMFAESDAFVTLPGGIGTLEEIVEIMTWAQLGRHRKPMVFANIGGFWNPLLNLIEHMADEGFVHSRNQLKPLVIDQVKDIVPGIIKAARDHAEGNEAVIGKL